MTMLGCHSARMNCTAPLSGPCSSSVTTQHTGINVPTDGGAANTKVGVGRKPLDSRLKDHV
jgi:hypothetical protein